MLSAFLKEILDLVYPDKLRCLSCSKPLKNYNGYQMCGYCRSMLEFLKGRLCTKCGRPLMDEYSECICSECLGRGTYFDEASSVFEFEGVVQDMLYKLKYAGETDIAISLGKFMAEKLKSKKWLVDFIIPVPLHPDRLKERGFNQSYLLASCVGRECGIDVRDDVLLRKRYTDSQATLSRYDRLHNVKDAFEAARENRVKGRSILIIDDIMTTGTTLNECSKAIRRYSPKKVYCLTVACPFHQK